MPKPITHISSITLTDEAMLRIAVWVDAHLNDERSDDDTIHAVITDIRLAIWEQAGRGALTAYRYTLPAPLTNSGRDQYLDLPANWVRIHREAEQVPSASRCVH